MWVAWLGLIGCKGPAVVDAAAIHQLTASCDVVAGSDKFAFDSGADPVAPICQLTDPTSGHVAAFWWHTDLDVDCDGGTTDTCKADPAYQPETSATTSAGAPLDASVVPFIVIPLPSARFDYAASGIALGDAAVVSYGLETAYAVFGDEDPEDIIGEGSYALASALGIDPDPVSGGADQGVTFVVFVGKDARVSPIEDPTQAEAVGKPLAQKLLR